MSDDFEIGEIRDMLSGVIDAEDGGLESDELCPDTVSISAIQERYIDSALAGTGALKNVYKCYDVVMDRYVALAELQDKHGKALYDAFVYEARLTASLSHPNIIKVHDIGVNVDGRPFFTMDLKSGVHLGEYTRHLSIDKKLDVFNLVCGAIAHAHSKGIVHLDLKPENIQCDAYGEVLVCDWGLSKALVEGGRRLATMGNMELIEVAHMTLYGELKGSPGYMAPEQIEQGEKDVRTDIYALGAILYYLCTGQKVFTGDVATVLKATVDTVPQKASSVNRALPSSLSMVIMKCLEKQASDRYQSVDQLVMDLERYRSGRSTSIERGDALKESVLFCQRNSQKVVLAMVCLLVLSLFYIWNDRRLEAQERQQSIAQAKIEKINEDLVDVVVEYDAFEKALTESKRDLSLRLYDAAYTRWKQFYGKLETDSSILDLIDEIALLTRKASTIDVTGKGQWLDMQSNAIKLNLKRVLEVDYKHKNNRVDQLVKVANLFPNYEFGRKKRPSNHELQRLIKAFGNDESFNGEFLTFVMYYDVRSRDDFSEYASVIASYLNYYNARNDCTLRYDRALDRMVIKGGEVLDCHMRYVDEYYLQFLSVDQLRLEGTQFRFSSLAGARVRVLDCSRVQNFSHLSLPWFHKVEGLEEVILPNYMDLAERELIQSKLGSGIQCH